MDVVFQVIVDYVLVLNVDLDGLFQMQIFQLDYNSFLGVIGIGCIMCGKVKINFLVIVIGVDGKKCNGCILKIMGYFGL